MQTLDEVINFYSDKPKHENPCPEKVDGQIKERLDLSDQEKRYLRAFLLSLTDDVSQRKNTKKHLEEFKHKTLPPALQKFEVEPISE